MMCVYDFIHHQTSHARTAEPQLLYSNRHAQYPMVILSDIQTSTKCISTAHNAVVYHTCRRPRNSKWSMVSRQTAVVIAPTMYAAAKR